MQREGIAVSVGDEALFWVLVALLAQVHVGSDLFLGVAKNGT
jgi:hypothetical protein